MEQEHVLGGARLDRPEARLVFVDVETSGLDPERHEIYEIALVTGDDPELDYKHWWLPIDLERADATALRISGYYERHPAANPDEAWGSHDLKGIAGELARRTAGAHLVGVNPAFDATFLAAFIRRHGHAAAWHYHLIDVLPLIAGRYRIAPPWQSRELSAAVHVDPPADDDRHTALGDALWAQRMYEAVYG